MSTEQSPYVVTIHARGGKVKRPIPAISDKEALLYVQRHYTRNAYCLKRTLPGQPEHELWAVHWFNSRSASQIGLASFIERADTTPVTPLVSLKETPVQKPSDKTCHHMISTKAVRRMAELCKKNLTYPQIAKTLNDEGYRTVMKREYSAANVVLLTQQFEKEMEQLLAGTTEEELLAGIETPPVTTSQPVSVAPETTPELLPTTELSTETEPAPEKTSLLQQVTMTDLTVPTRPQHPSVDHLPALSWDEVVSTLVSYLHQAWGRVDETWNQIERIAKAYRELEQKYGALTIAEADLKTAREQHERLKYEFDVQKLALDEKDHEITRLKAELEAQAQLPKQRQLSERDKEALSSLSGYRA